MRAGVESAVNGIVIIVTLFGFFAMPYSLAAYIPKFFFGAVLAFIAFDLMLDWLWHVRKVVPIQEFLLIWATFIAINATNLEVGFAIGRSL
jgi:SulP family sulfate permease